VKIGVISDTHLEEPTPLLEDTVRRYFQDVDMIIHAGDLVTLHILDAFKDKKVVAVTGNNDGPEVKRILPAKQIIKAGDFRIGVIHGWGWPMGMGRKVSRELEGVDCIVYGHSHWPASYHRDGILYFNPGAFSSGLPLPGRRTIGILTIDRQIHGRIIRVR